MTALDDFVNGFVEKGWTSQPFDRMLDIVRAGETTAFVRRILRDLSKGGTFLDASLSYMPLDAFDSVVPEALACIRADPNTRDDGPGSVIAYASLQAVQSLHPHLDEIWELEPNAGSYFEMWPWRGAWGQTCPDLAEVYDREPDSRDGRRAWDALLQSRSLPCLQAAVARASTITEPWSRDRLGPWAPADAWFKKVGFDLVGDDLIRLCPDTPYHLRFDADYLGREGEPVHVRPGTHPTWFDLGQAELTAGFGGEVDTTCAVCSDHLHRMLAIDPIPPGLGIDSRHRVTFVTCLSCLGWTEGILQFQHAANGEPTPVGYVGEPTPPQFPATAFLPTTVGLVPTPERWRFQDWGLANSRENLNRIGGEPTWIQNADYPTCASCGSTMHFVFQLDSEFRTDDGGGWLWGSGGIAYFFWCDGCAVSACFWQCT